jgi:hypothetical protein
MQADVSPVAELFVAPADVLRRDGHPARSVSIGEG